MRVIRCATGASLALSGLLVLFACGSLVGVEDVVRRPSEPAGEAGTSGAAADDSPACRACGPGCVDPLRDASSCGRCGHVCADGEPCIAGVCDRRLHGSSGARSACFRGDDGIVRCWGKNTTGQLGRGTLSQAEPVPAPFLAPASRFAVTDGVATCALGDDEIVRCGGGNARGNLGTGKMGGSTDCEGAPVCELTPLPARLSQPVDDIVAGGADDTAGYVCARLRDGTASCWGRGIDRATPSPRRARVAAVGSGNAFACFLGFDGTLACFGAAYGISGGPTSWEAIPVPIVIPTAPRSSLLGVSSRTVCLAEGTRLSCYGSNALGQVGTGVATGPTIVGVVDVVHPADADIVQIAGGGEHFCALDANGAVSCWGSARRVGAAAAVAEACAEGPCHPKPIRVLEGVREIAAGNDFTLARMKDGRLFGWGETPSASCVLVDDGHCAQEGFDSPRELFDN